MLIDLIHNSITRFYRFRIPNHLKQDGSRKGLSLLTYASKRLEYMLSQLSIDAIALARTCVIIALGFSTIFGAT